VSNTPQAAGTAREQTGHVADSAKQHTHEVAGTAKNEAHNVTGAARSEAQNVLGTATEQARSVLEEVTGELSQKGDEHAGRLSKRLRELSSELRSMAEKADEQGLAVSAVQTLGEQSERLADRLSEGGTKGIASDLRRYARNSPGSFLLAAAVAGVATGRVTRGAKDESKQSSGGQSPGQPSGTAAPVGASPVEPAVVAVEADVYAPPAGTAPAAEPYPAAQTYAPSERGGRL
jgi:vacuolar-type H+-ATPase subunit H